MPNAGLQHRAGRLVVAGRRRGDTVAQRLGVALRDARLAAGMRQRELATESGLSQPRVSELERGLGAAASIATWAVVAAAVGEQLVGFLEAAPGANPPRDIEHLRRQSAVIDLAKAGGWRALPELAIDPGAIRSRSIDVVLLRREAREVIVVEIWDWFDDVGAALRSIDGKRERLGAMLTEAKGAPNRHQVTIRCLFVVRRTRRNERLVHDLRPLFAARFSGSARAWLRTLTDPDADLPVEDGLLWSVANRTLQASRLPRN